MKVVMTNLDGHPVKNRAPVQRTHFRRTPRLPFANNPEVSRTFSPARPGPAPLKTTKVAVKNNPSCSKRKI